MSKLSLFLILILVVTVLSSKKPDFVLKKTQAHLPVDEMTTFMVDLHFYNGDINSQYIAFHYCGPTKDGLSQCTLFDGSSKDARFIGTEFVIEKKIFDSLPEEEKPLWHSHVYEVKSGLIAFPGMDADDEWKQLEWLVGTYGKVVDVWHQGYDLPITPPMVVHALALDSQVDWDLADFQDTLCDLPTTHVQRRKLREKLKVPEKAKGADQYLETGKAAQYAVVFLDIEDGARVHRKNVGTDYDDTSKDL